MRLRRLNDAGIIRFEEFLDTVKSGEPDPIPEGLLTNSATSEELGSEVEVDQTPFSSRMEAAEHLYDAMHDKDLGLVDRDRGLWVWLSLYYFEQLCPVRTDGTRRPGERARWIPHTQNHQRYYRHLLAGPYRIYRAHSASPDSARILLQGPLDRPGDVVEQLASRQELVTNASVLEAASNLYMNKGGGLKRGAAGKADGSTRRFVEVLGQFDLTYDLYGMSPDDLLALLPAEFDRFRNSDAKPV